MTAPTLAERTGRIRALIEALETKGYRVPAEQLRHASYVPGWSVRVHGHGLYDIDVAGQASAVLTRDDTLALLLARWVEAARAEVYAHENDVEEAATPATSVTSFHVAVDVEGLLTRRDVIVDLQDDGVAMDDRAARIKLLALFAQGVRRIPIGEPCEGFSSVTGCPGHRRVAP